MKLHFAALLLFVFILVGNSFADDQNIQPIPHPQNQKIFFGEDKQWYMGNQTVERDVAIAAIKTNEEAASAYGTAMGFYYPGMVLAYAGSFAVGYGVVELLFIDAEVGLYITLGGLGVAGISLLLTKIANGYMREAIDLYNKGLPISETNTSLRLKVVPTQQGGIAVALAF